jgi:DNA-binding response OmpR family regulator
MATKTVNNQNDQVREFANSHILVIDDDSPVTKLVTKFLDNAGYANVKAMTDSTLAIDAIRQQLPDLVLLDIFMPEINGLEILKQIRADSSLDDVVVLMLSSAGKEEQFKSLEMGAMGFIHKPLDADKMVSEVAKAFRVASRFGAF